MGRFAKFAARLIDSVSWAGAVVAGSLMFIAVILVVYGVIMRYIFRSPAAWTVELTGFMFLGVVAFTLAYVLRTGGHIGVDFLVSRLSQKGQRIQAIFGCIVLIIYAAIAGWAGWLTTLEYLQKGRTSEALQIPLAATQIILPISFLVLCLAALAQISREVAVLKGEPGSTAGAHGHGGKG